MSVHGVRKLGLLLALACVAGQPLLPSLAVALTDRLHTDEHTHVAEVLPVGGRLHLVLSHEGGEPHPRGAGPRDSISDAHHVLAALSADAGTPTRSAGAASAPALAVASHSPFPRTIAANGLRSPEPRARDATALRTVVLRL